MKDNVLEELRPNEGRFSTRLVLTRASFRQAGDKNASSFSVSASILPREDQRQLAKVVSQSVPRAREQ